MKSFIIPSFIQNSKENSRFVKIFKTWYLKQKRFSLKSIKKVNFILWLISPLGKSEELPDHKKTKTFEQSSASSGEKTMKIIWLKEVNCIRLAQFFRELFRVKKGVAHALNRTNVKLPLWSELRTVLVTASL